MSWLDGTRLLLLAALCLHGSHLEDVGSLEVFYERKAISAPAGTSVRLTCTATYDLTSCSSVHVGWCSSSSSSSSSSCQEMRNPRRYATTVNETAMGGMNRRRRDVTTEILHVSSGDDGYYQCNGVCEDGETVHGHLITVICE